MKSLITIFFLFPFQIILAQNPANSLNPVIDSEKVVSWIKENAYTLKSVEPGSGFEDLLSFEQILKNVTIVGLGEATHGTKEFIQMKHKMIEFLVMEMGFTVIATEFDFIGANNINDYILYGKGDAYSALGSQGLAVWDTEEIIDLIEWLKNYNQSVPEEMRVKLRGFDFRENYPGNNFTLIKNYLRKVDPSVAIQEDSLISLVKLADSGKLKGVNVDSCKNEFLKLLANFSINSGIYIQNSSLKEYKTILERIKIIAENLTFNSLTNNDQRALYNEKERLRDFYMASNFMGFVQDEPPDTKFIIWAHNMHIAKTDPTENDNIRMFGNYLKEAYGDKYYAFGFSFDKGSFQSWGWTDKMESLGMMEFTVKDYHPRTLDWYLSKTGLNPFIINFRTNQIPKFMDDFLNTRLLTRRVGGSVVKSHVEMMNGPIVLKKAYDAIIFINNTTSATPIVSQKTLIK